MLKPANKHTPLQMYHGDADEVVAHEWGQLTYNKIKELGREGVRGFRTYKGMGHSSSREEVEDLCGFLKEVLPAK